MLIAASRTDMSSSNYADALKRLADRGGSGNVTDLARETPGYDATKFTGQNYASQTHGPSVHIAEAEPLTGSPSTSTMRDLARQALDHL
ncbi:hypothetical protein E1202_17350 [Saccharopolyspora karakumensis]|uniref:Uncharacterized protein n=1 Tax=Saccharopolyspora karakumensis TaxID=2530386 RepID=A0A4R5BPG5_9PSEU|nr:hypothetical protein [Saccharopolyspora karakumensis]TDD87080.1 hypothetical protein E1202_17350 [Saccharopolyspora karakumensis]